MKITQRQLNSGPYRLFSAEADPGSAPYIIAGSRMYVLGLASGEIAPIGAEHLVGAMGGAWAHPVRVADGVTVTLTDPAGRPLPVAAATFEETLATVTWRWRCGDLAVQRHDMIAADEPVWQIAVTFANQGAAPVAGRLEAAAHLRFLGAWFGRLSSGGGDYRVDDNLVLGSDREQTGWGVAFGAAAPPTAWSFRAEPPATVATLAYAFELAPGQARTWTLWLAAGQRAGSREALEQWRAIAARGGVAPVAPADDLPRLESPDADLARDFALAQANLRLLQADYPDPGRYFLAGLPEYPQLFGCDTTYTVPGAVAAGFASTAHQALLTLADYAGRACGRIPHELTTNGRIFHPGNIQETPQFTIACWDYLRWTGDLEFARRVFPVCREGIRDLLPAFAGPDGRYPYGDGMVERMGMGSRKLDSACYAYAGLLALAQLAEALGDAAAPDYLAEAAALRVAFERDWWLEAEGLYADSMHSDGRLQLDGHWTIVLPVQLGLAAPDRAARVLDRIERAWVNAWGLVHTRVREELVWTLPTGLLALAAFEQGRADLGLRLLHNIALTAQRGTLGAFKELIPEGLCFIQLWSAGLYLQGVLEGLLGLHPAAHRHRLELAPALPAGMPAVTLRGLRIGAHRLDLAISPQAVQIDHLCGPQPLILRYAGSDRALDVGARFEAPAPKGGDATTNDNS